MEYLLIALLFLHMIGLGLGFAGGLGHNVTVAGLLRKGRDERPALWSVEPVFAFLLRSGFGLLLVSGPLLVWLKYGGVTGLSHWFWVKMTFVALALVADGILSRNVRAWRRGDEAAGRRAAVLHRVSGLSIVVVVLAAVITFR